MPRPQRAVKVATPDELVMALWVSVLPLGRRQVMDTVAPLSAGAAAGAHRHPPVTVMLVRPEAESEMLLTRMLLAAAAVTLTGISVWVQLPRVS